MQIFPGQDVRKKGVPKQLCQVLHGIPVGVGNIQAGRIEGQPCEFHPDSGVQKHQFFLTVFIFADGEIFVKTPDIFRRFAFIAQEVAQRILQPVRRQAGGIVVRNGITVVIPDIFRVHAVFAQQGADLCGTADDLLRAGFGGFLLHIVPVEKVHGMGKDRGADIVEQPGDVARLGEDMVVKVIEINGDRIRASRKAVLLEEQGHPWNPEETARPQRDRGDRRR